MEKCINLIQNKTTKCIGLLALMVNLPQNNNNESFKGCTQGMVQPKKIFFISQNSTILPLANSRPSHFPSFPSFRAYTFNRKNIYEIPR